MNTRTCQICGYTKAIEKKKWPACGWAANTAPKEGDKLNRILKWESSMIDQVRGVFPQGKSGDIAIPEIQRPFVWSAVQVRKFLDSLFQGYPVGYLIAWRNPDVKLKDGTSSSGKRILIDGHSG